MVRRSARLGLIGAMACLLAAGAASGLAMVKPAERWTSASAANAPLSSTQPLSMYLPLITTAPPPRQTTLTTTTINILSHAYQSALVRRYNGTYNFYYNQLDRAAYDPTPVTTRTFALLVLENEYLRLSLLPELGGRVYQVSFKPTGQALFYQNAVLKPSPWGPTEMGWWLAAGGIEWCLPVAEHGYEWDEPWSYSLSPASDGITVTLRDTNASDRLRASVAVSLRDGEALFHLTPAIENPTAQALDVHFWLNAMLAPGTANAPSAALRFMLPSSAATVHSTGDPRLPAAGSVMSWPLYNGVDWSLLGNWRQWFGFFAYPQAQQDFQAVYDASANLGVVRTYDSGSAPGAKFFGLGWGNDALSPALYTDDDSRYVEMHGGLTPTFADAYHLNAGQRLTWEEQWYPAALLGGLTWANADVALFVEPAATTMRVHVVTTRAQANVRVELRRRADQSLLFSDHLPQVAPAQAYHSPAIPTTLAVSETTVRVYAGDVLLGLY